MFWKLTQTILFPQGINDGASFFVDQSSGSTEVTPFSVIIKDSVVEGVGDVSIGFFSDNGLLAINNLEVTDVGFAGSLINVVGRGTALLNDIRVSQSDMVSTKLASYLYPCIYPFQDVSSCSWLKNVA